jgi:hypothetical protein
MQSLAAVALTARLAAILRFDMPAADSLSTSRILRMGNLPPGMPRSLWKRSEAMPIRGSPNGARHTRPQAGRDRPKWVVAINRNGWSQSIGIAGRDHPVRAQCTIMILLGSWVVCNLWSTSAAGDGATSRRG